MASLANRPAEAADPGIDNRSQRFVIPKLDSVAERVREPVIYVLAEFVR